VHISTVGTTRTLRLVFRRSALCGIPDLRKRGAPSGSSTDRTLSLVHGSRILSKMSPGAGHRTPRPHISVRKGRERVLSTVIRKQARRSKPCDHQNFPEAFFPNRSLVEGREWPPHQKCTLMNLKTSCSFGGFSSTSIPSSFARARIFGDGKPVISRAGMKIAS